MAETRSNSQLPAVKPDTAEPTDGWKILPLGPRIVCVWTLCFVFLGGLLGALHGGFSRWKETSPPRPTVEDFAKRLVDEKENSSNDIAMRSLFPATNPRSSIETNPLLQPPLGATYAIEAAEETEPEETGIVSSIQKFMTRIESCIARAFFGIPVGALFGLVIGAFVGILWWIILAIVARVTRRPIEMVYDDWGSSYRAEENQRRLEKILGNDRGLKSEGS